ADGRWSANDKTWGAGSAWAGASWSQGSWERPDMSNPDSRLGWGEYSLWRWLAGTRVAVSRRSDRVLKVLDLDWRKKFEDFPDTILASAVGPEVILKQLDILSGQRQDDEMRRTGRECLRGCQRRQGEFSSIYAARMGQVFYQPMLKILSGSAGECTELLRALPEMDMNLNEMLARGSGGKKTLLESEGARPSPTRVPRGDDEYCQSTSSLNSEHENHALTAIDQADLAELEAPTVLAELSADNKKSWKDDEDYEGRSKVGRRFSPTASALEIELSDEDIEDM
ncbi:unnamed protein product, partial [Prorocentrum cordatum]